MLSRVADSIYWLSRYVERAENVARFIDVNLHLRLDSGAGVVPQWQPLVDTTGDREAFKRRYPEASQTNVIQFLTFDPDNTNSILACLRAARENARCVREIISSDMWLQLNKFYLMVQSASDDPGLFRAPYEFFHEVKRASQSFTGITDATMTHGEAWHFGRLGRMLERADKTSRILDVKYFLLLPSVDQVGSPVDDIQWAALLRSASAFEMYRKQHGRISPRGVVDFLLLDPQFPRAIRFCLQDARDSFHAISGTPSGTFRHSPEKLLGQLCSDLAYATVDDIVSRGPHEYLDELQTKINLVGMGIFDTFFAVRAPDQSRVAVRSHR
jgi:uncharacterized alpha-E superfamily protein